MSRYPARTSANSWSPLSELFREMDQALYGQNWHPACDVEEAEGHYLLTLEMPGIPKDKINLEVLDNQLTISGERNQKSKSESEGRWYSERQYGKFQRSFNFPAGVNAEKIEAQYEDGILKVIVPKAETSKPRQIKIGNDSSTRVA